MGESLNILITAGGTSEPIDNVRVITNLGTGRLGSLIADRFAEEDSVGKIFYVCSSRSVTPVSDKVTVVNIGSTHDLKKKLEEKGVTQIAHFGPLYRFQVVADMGYDQEEIAKTCPVCEEVFYKRFTHLPLYGLSDEQLQYMADAVLESVAEMQAGK